LSLEARDVDVVEEGISRGVLVCVSVTFVKEEEAEAPWKLDGFGDEIPFLEYIEGWMCRCFHRRIWLLA
jgi:hypothetical protein